MLSSARSTPPPRRDTDPLSKSAAEVTLIVEATVERDLRKRQVGGQKQFLRPVKSGTDQPLMRCNPRGCIKGADKIATRNSAVTRDLSNIDRPRKMLKHQLLGLPLLPHGKPRRACTAHGLVTVKPRRCELLGADATRRSARGDVRRWLEAPLMEGAGAIGRWELPTPCGVCAVASNTLPVAPGRDGEDGQHEIGP